MQRLRERVALSIPHEEDQHAVKAVLFPEGSHGVKRHTFATLLIQNGEPIPYVQSQLGHSTIKLTVDTYTHWMPGKNREAMDRLPVAIQA